MRLGVGDDNGNRRRRRSDMRKGLEPSNAGGLEKLKKGRSQILQRLLMEPVPPTL